MKILVMQLARLGDIYMGWPALRALRRKYPTARIDLLVRSKFKVAAEGLEAVDRLVVFPTSEFLEPLMSDQPQDEEAISRLQTWTETLRQESYDQILNLTYSPFSSYLTHALSGEKTFVTGYTRHEDGWLRVADEVSAYFHAQVGLDRPGRIHLCDFFAALLDVNLEPQDWRAPTGLNVSEALQLLVPEDYLVLHLGASQEHKKVPPFVWARAIQHIGRRHPKLGVVLIGAQGEEGLAHEICRTVPEGFVIDLVGKTDLKELFPLLQDAQLLIGADSAPMHMASLTGTPCLNLSVGEVNFWETGPRSSRSWVWRVENPLELSSEVLAQAVSSILRGEEPVNLIRHVGGTPAYRLPSSQADRSSFAWGLIQALYLGAPFPVTEDYLFVEGVQHLLQLNEVVLEQLVDERLEPEVLGNLIDRADEVFSSIEKQIPELGVFVRWLRTEKTRIPPGDPQQIRSEMKRVHSILKGLLRPYDPQGWEGGEDEKIPNRG